MARKKNVLPSYILHAQSGQARIRIDGRDYLLGTYGSEESRIRYGELIAKHASGLPIGAGWTRGNINKNVCRVRSVFRWGVENGLVPEATLSALKALAALSAGRSDAVEGRKRRAVSDEHLLAVRKRLGPRNQDIFDLLLLCGARPGELLSITWNMVDKSGGDVWVVELQQHKNSHKGQSRKLCFGPRAQAILSKYADIPPANRIFPSRRDTLSQAIADACRKAKVAPFVPHELRHTAATPSP